MNQLVLSNIAIRIIWLCRFVFGVERTVVRHGQSLSREQLNEIQNELEGSVFVGEVAQNGDCVVVEWSLIDPIFVVFSVLIALFLVSFLGSFIAGLIMLEPFLVLLGLAGVAVIAVISRFGMASYRPSIREALRSIDQ
ncbi:hypothetical protein [Hyphobacterium sp.]|uniref:hypothetical protein n=1 Tax=Hyphobacterium sp. TaxID=2004662 RepID=UPI003BAD41F4